MAERLTIIQVSDTHLSRTHAWFTANWPVFVDEMEQRKPDIIVNSGDLSFNGPDNPDDLAFARACHEQLTAPWQAIAGNHDVGEAPSASRLKQPVNDARLSAWRENIGPSWWCTDIDKDELRLRLVGLDSALMGSGHGEEARQAAFLEESLAQRDGRSVLVFTHMPPFGEDPDDPRVTTHCILPEPRRWLLDRCLGGGVVTISCGHIHRHTIRDYRGLPIVTAPATSFVNIPAVPQSNVTPMRAGYLLWQYDGSGLRHEVIRPGLFMTIDASNWTESASTTTTMPERRLAV